VTEASDSTVAAVRAHSVCGVE